MAQLPEEQLVKHLDQVNAVATKYLEGLGPSEIATELSIPRTRVVSLLSDWREMIGSNEAIHARAREALAGADVHYSKLINRTYEVVEEADLNSDLKNKLAAIKLIADIEAKRLDQLHRAGLLDNKEIAEELANMERKHEIIINILKEIATKHPQIRTEILSRLSEVSSGVIVIDS
jgi:hypothetical protein